MLTVARPATSGSEASSAGEHDEGEGIERAQTLGQFLGWPGIGG